MKTPISLCGLRQFSAATCALFLLSSVGMTLLADDPPPLRPVVVTGAGETAEKATEDALRNAVEQAVGALIDAKTMVEGEQVIQDKILRMSNAFVDKYDVLKRWSEGNLQYCRISAQVKSRELRATLGAEPIFKGKIEGESLGAQIFGEMNAKTGTEEVLSAFFENLRQKTLYAKVTGRPVPETTIGKGSATLSLPVEVGIDQTAYESVVESTLPKLRAVSRASAKATVSFSVQSEIDRSARAVPVAYGNKTFSKEAASVSLLSSSSGAVGSGLVPKIWGSITGGGGPGASSGGPWWNQRNGGNGSGQAKEFQEAVTAAAGGLQKSDRSATTATLAIISDISKSGRAVIHTLSIDKDVYCRLARSLTENELSLTAALMDRSARELSGQTVRFSETKFLAFPDFPWYQSVLFVVPGQLDYRFAYATSWHGTFAVTMPISDVSLIDRVEMKFEQSRKTSSHGYRVSVPGC